MSFIQPILLITLFLLTIHSIQTQYKAGVGIYDITGPAADVGMMGYAMVDQRTHGIHFRLRARSYVVASKAQPDGIVAYVNLDICFASHAIKENVLEILEKHAPGVFTHENLMISGTHTHSGPGGFSWYTLYDLTSFGFNKQNFEAIVSGTAYSVLKAYNNMRDANMYVNIGHLSSPMTNINRSPTAYLNNPEEERKRYDFDVDKEIITLRFEDSNGVGFGSVAWFPVHGTSMNNENLLISGDNKGYAAYLFEKKMNGNNTMAGKGDFVAAFGQCNEGDVSPNTKGAFCDNGDRCEEASSTCGGKSETCHSYGPGGKNDFESVRVIGEQQFEKAFSMYNAKGNLNKGDIRKVHTFLEMTKMDVMPEYTGLSKTVKTCVGALGDSFAAGTTDGPGDFNFVQGTNSSDVNPYWNYISHFFISDPPKDQEECHYPKPILLYPGGSKLPTPWVASILPIQMFKMGDLFIVAVPGEFTTMSGRRLKESIKKKLIMNGIANDNSTFVISGLANSYSQYITTTEEYHVQRYEGASTLFGPYTLPYYIQEFNKLADYLSENKPSPPGTKPKDWSKDIVELLPEHIFDAGNIGKVKKAPAPSYKIGQTASVVFRSGNPRNNLHTEETFLTVERKDGDKWTTVATDGDWETKFKWERLLDVFESYATIEWDIPQETAPGIYRIKHYCEGKALFSGKITSYVGTSPEFEVTY